MKVYLPLNEKGIEELEKCQETETENLKVYEFSPNDYFYLENKRYFDFLNVECDCLIDLYEETNITYDKLQNAIEITEILIKQSTDKRFIELGNEFLEIFRKAKQSNTYVNIYCYGNPEIVNG